MDLDRRLDIDHLDWLPIPADLQDGLSRTPLSKRQLDSWSLALQAKRIPCQGGRAEGGWQLLVPAPQLADACRELRAFEEQNRDWPPPRPEEVPEAQTSVTTVWVLVALASFHALTLQPFSRLGIHPADWLNLGNAQAGKILDGEWWRLVTALCLHSDAVHLFGNIVVGGLFVDRLNRILGNGLGWLLVLMTGVLGNLANAFMQAPDHRSIGASTAAFGAVGLLAAINLIRYRRNLQRRWPLPVAAAFGVLAMLGAGGENTDIGAHLFGFGFGIVLGFACGKLLWRWPRPAGPANTLLATLTGLLVLGSWLLAFI